MNFCLYSFFFGYLLYYLYCLATSLLYYHLTSVVSIIIVCKKCTIRINRSLKDRQSLEKATEKCQPQKFIFIMKNLSHFGHRLHPVHLTSSHIIMMACHTSSMKVVYHVKDTYMVEISIDRPIKWI